MTTVNYLLLLFLMKRRMYYSTDEAAKMLRWTRQEIVRKIWRGQIKAKKLGRKYLIHYKQIEKYKE